MSWFVGGERSWSAGVFPASAKLFFKNIQPNDVRSDKVCGPVPTISSNVGSAAVDMPFLSSAAKTWSMDFDFSMTTATTLDVFRLCVALESGVIMDFNPLGVRVNLGVRCLPPSRDVEPALPGVAQARRAQQAAPQGGGTSRQLAACAGRQWCRRMW